MQYTLEMLCVLMFVLSCLVFTKIVWMVAWYSVDGYLQRRRKNRKP